MPSSRQSLRSLHMVRDRENLHRQSGIRPRELRFEFLEERRLLSAASPQAELFNTSPALFVENQGQWPEESIRFLHQGDGATVAMTDTGLEFQVLRREPTETMAVEKMEDSLSPSPMNRLRQNSDVTHLLQFSAAFVGANAVSPVGLEPSDALFNYFVGDEANWRSDVAGWETVAYQGLYDGIDLHTWGLRSSLKYEFHVAPGADWSQIEVRYNGIAGLSLADDGALTVTLEDGWGQWKDDAPYIYQVIDGHQVEVAGRFELVDEVTYKFVVTGPYDADAPLIIDPDLAWSTYLGGSGSDRAYDVTTDAAGNILVTGETKSSGWISGGYDTSLNGTDAFVMKLSSAGVPVWSTYYGGSADEFGYSIATDSNGNVLVTGESMSSDTVSNAFVLKLNSAGQSPSSTSLNYDSVDLGIAIAADSANNVLIAGVSASSETSSDGFVTKLSPTLSSVWTRYLGVYASGVAVDAANNIFVSGNTDSTGFVTKLSSANAQFWNISLGGSDGYATGIDVDADGNALVTGYTESSGWAATGYDLDYGGGGDGFVAKLATTNGARLWSTYLGGGSEEIGWGVAVDDAGDVFVSGQTESSGWVSGGFDTVHDGNADAFLVKLSSLGGHVWSTYLGGSQSDIGWSVEADGEGASLVAGETQSSGWIPGAYKGAVDAFVVKFPAPNEPPVIESLVDTPEPVIRPANLMLSAAGVNDPDGEVVQVQFYRDTNGDSQWDAGDELLDADVDGSDGWNWTGSTAGWPLGVHAFFARAQDDSEAWSAPVSTTADVGNAIPVVTGLLAAPAPVTRPDGVTLTALGVSDPDDVVERVEFYRDANGNSAWDAGDQLLGADHDGSDGWSWTGSTAGWTLGQHTFFARAHDHDDAWSDPVSAVADVVNAVPVVGSLAGDRNPVPSGAALTLQAKDVSDPDGVVERVAFYRDANGDDTWNEVDDLLLGTDEDGTSGWTWAVDTTGWALGLCTFFARAQDNDGAWSIPLTGSVTVAYWQNLNNPFDVNGDDKVDAADVLSLVNEINLNGGGVLPPRSADNFYLPFFDVDGDGSLAPIDVLMVIHHINQANMPPSVSGGEGEAEWANESPIPAMAANRIADRPEMLWNRDSSDVVDMPAVASGNRGLTNSHQRPDDERTLPDWKPFLEDPLPADAIRDAYFATLG